MVVAATGFFDGVHKGHQKVLSELCRVAADEGKKSAVITFWPHPRNVLQQDACNLRLLNSLDEKERLIKDLGVDEFITIPFSREFSRLSTSEFLNGYLKQKYNVTTLIVGYDHRLGNNVNQSQQEMIETARSLGINVVRVEEFLIDNNIISSTRIRNLLNGGNVTSANAFLGYNYQLNGVVVSGQRLGRTIGFPTANMKLYNPLKAVPGNGVYAVWVEVFGKSYMGMCNIGTRPTVADSNERSIETYILDFDEDIYGLDLTVKFVEKIRDEQKFTSLQLLKEQLEKDKVSTLNLLRGKEGY
ncbi:MAG: bifunctional riboflavin kinase/FAD synthetase [Bacteroidales bacterium]|nr:bifunctional riboflavin kinase/FAD synthetase [Bacteroidales bacterium]